MATLEAPNLPLVELELITVASTRVQNHSNDPNYLGRDLVRHMAGGLTFPPSLLSPARGPRRGEGRLRARLVQ